MPIIHPNHNELRGDQAGGLVVNESDWITMQNYYDVLGVPRNASGSQIREAYKKLARGSTSDCYTVGNDGLSFEVLRSAYQTLIDARKRASYDYKLSKDQLLFESEHYQSKIIREERDIAAPTAFGVFGKIVKHADTAVDCSAKAEFDSMSEIIKVQTNLLNRLCKIFGMA